MRLGNERRAGNYSRGSHPTRRLRHDFRQAVHSHFLPERYANEQSWKDAIEHSEVRLQWDPDHDPSGAPLERRAIQLGLRGSVLRNYAREWIVSIEDITPFFHEQHQRLLSHGEAQLITPREEVYPVADAEVARRLGML